MKKPLSAYQAIFFDAGDTLITIPEVQGVIHHYLSEQSLFREPAEIGTTVQEAIQQFYYEKQYLVYEECSPESDRLFWTELYLYILRRLRVHDEWEQERIFACCHELYDMFVAPAYYEMFDDVIATLERLQQMGFRLGIISNFAPTLKAILQHKGILDYFDPVLVSTEVGLEKPNPAIFELAIKQSGIRAEHILYVGDHERNDIWAPAQVGIDAIRIKRYPYMEGAGIVSLHQLFEVTHEAV